MQMEWDQEIPYRDRGSLLRNHPALYAIVHGERILYVGATKRLRWRILWHDKAPLLTEIEQDSTLRIAWSERQTKPTPEEEQSAIDELRPEWNRARVTRRKYLLAAPNKPRCHVELRIAQKAYYCQYCDIEIRAGQMYGRTANFGAVCLVCIERIGQEVSVPVSEVKPFIVRVPRLDSHLHHQIRVAAVQRGVKIGEIINEAMRMWLEAQRSTDNDRPRQKPKEQSQ